MALGRSSYASKAAYFYLMNQSFNPPKEIVSILITVVMAFTLLCFVSFKAQIPRIVLARQAVEREEALYG